jgi:hypothetical protein
LYEAYCEFAETISDKPFAQRTFSKCLKEREFGLVSKRIDGIMTRCIQGIRLKQKEGTAPTVDMFDFAPDAE